MELVLNFAGLLVTLTIVCLGWQQTRRSGSDRQTQLVALVLLVLILFPVISVTDDLLAMHNPAEMDTGGRRDHIVTGGHSSPQPATVSPQPPLLALHFGLLGFAAPDAHPVPMPSVPAVAQIENRPPPTA